ncbi:MAG: L-rhamnose isomerase [Bacilli bacterium]
MGDTNFFSEQEERGVDVTRAQEFLTRFQIETPSWGYGDSGTRFQVFRQAGAARTPLEKLADAAVVNRLTGACSRVAIHIPWDQVEQYGTLREFAQGLGLTIGAVNPNLFQDDDYRLGSVCHPDVRVREKAVAHVEECIRVAEEVGSDTISLWLADGTNYPGQDDFRARKHRLLEALFRVYGKLPSGMRLLIEYKYFEPAFYHTDIPDWGTALLLAQRLGPQAQVLVDLGHHPQGANVEQIVTNLLDEGKLGGFHFNSRRYADDDLIVGAVDPYELYLIFAELVKAEFVHADLRDDARRIAYMIDQSHAIEPKIPALIRSVMNVQTALAKALLIDFRALATAQASGDVLAAEGVMRDAFELDVRPLLRRVREIVGAPPDPLQAYLHSDHPQRILARGVGGQG